MQEIESQTEAELQHSDDNKDNSEKGKDHKWTEGDEITLVRVRFPGNSKSFPFIVGKRSFQYGQKVLAMSDRGMDVGYINSFPYSTKFKKSMLPLRSIAQVASQSDLDTQKANVDKQREAENICARLIKQLKLDMNVTHVEIIQFGKKMVFYFTSPARVDFRELVKNLVGELKMRIELRQISVRDRTAALGSIGACGLSTCCSSFLKNYGHVNIKMAKNQNLALIPTKINGVCGQIKCCIKYEDDVYSEKRKSLPKEGLCLQARNGDKGKVQRLHILIGQFDMLTEKGQIRRYSIDEFDIKNKLPADWKLPERFDHIVNETKTVIGLKPEEQAKAEQFSTEVSELQAANKNLEDLEKDPPKKEEKKDDNKNRPPANQQRRRNQRNRRPRKPHNQEAKNNDGPKKS